MGKRGAQTFEEKIGVEKFKELLKRIDIEGIALLYCDHFIEDKDKKKCKACKRTIYRAKQRIQKRERKEKRYDPMEKFEDIPEIQTFSNYEGHKKSFRSELRQLERMWMWIKQEPIESRAKEETPKFANLSRPALWDINHILYILQKIKELRVAPYSWKQTLRRFFESQGNIELQKHKKIKAKRSDMRSPKGPARKQTSFVPSLMSKIWEYLDSKGKLAVDLHLTVKSREGDRGQGSLLDIQWKHINWTDQFYGLPMVTIDVFEPKTSGGTWWRHCPVDLWFGDLSKRLKEKWEKLDRPKEGYVLDFTYEQYRNLWTKISKHIGRKLEPHDCRRSSASWLRDLGLSDLALGQYNPSTGEAIGYTGVGWENSEIFYQRYGKMNPKAIFNAQLKLNTKIFSGLILKILEERAKQFNIIQNRSR